VVFKLLPYFTTPALILKLKGRVLLCICPRKYYYTSSAPTLKLEDTLYFNITLECVQSLLCTLDIGENQEKLQSYIVELWGEWVSIKMICIILSKEVIVYYRITQFDLRGIRIFIFHFISCCQM